MDYLDAHDKGEHQGQTSGLGEPGFDLPPEGARILGVLEYWKNDTLRGLLAVTPLLQYSNSPGDLLLVKPPPSATLYEPEAHRTWPLRSQ